MLRHRTGYLSESRKKAPIPPRRKLSKQKRRGVIRGVAKERQGKSKGRKRREGWRETRR